MSVCYNYILNKNDNTIAKLFANKNPHIYLLFYYTLYIGYC